MSNGQNVLVLFRIPKDMTLEKFDELMNRLCDLSPKLCDHLKGERKARFPQEPPNPLWHTE